MHARPIKGRRPATLAAALVLLALGCAAPQPKPVSAPQDTLPPPPERPAPPAAPPQFRLPPPPPEVKLEAPPAAAKRVAVVITERLGRAETPRRDPESEAILAEALLSAGADLGLEVVKRGVHDDILERDLESLALRGLGESAPILSNLLRAGVDYLALGELGGSEVERARGGAVVAERVHLHAGVQLVQTDDATVLAAANADAEAPTARETKTRALAEAAAKLIDSLRSRPKGPGHRPVTITVDGLGGFEEADRIARKLREVEGVVWSREMRFSAGRSEARSGVARLEIAFRGSAEELRARIQALDAGVKLEVTKIEGGRWNYHAAPNRSEK